MSNLVVIIKHTGHSQHGGEEIAPLRVFRINPNSPLAPKVATLLAL